MLITHPGQSIVHVDMVTDITCILDDDDRGNANVPSIFFLFTNGNFAAWKFKTVADRDAVYANIQKLATSV